MKIFTTFLLSISILFGGINTSFASSNCKVNLNNGAGGIQNFLENCSQNTQGVEVGRVTEGKESEKFQKKVIDLVEKAIQFAALFSIAAMVVSGILYTTAYGSDEKLTKAKKTAIFAGIGLVVSLISFPFVNTVISFLYNIGSGS